MGNYFSYQSTTPQTTVDTTPQTTVDTTPQTTVDTTPQTTVDATPQTTVDATNKYFDRVKEIKNKYIGAQDALLSNKEFIVNNTCYKNLKMNYKSTHKLVPVSQKIYYHSKHEKVYTLIFPKLPTLSNENSYVYKNLKFSKSSKYNSLINKCILEIGGSRIDAVYNPMFNVLRHVYNIKDDFVIPFYFCTNDNYLPMLSQHECRINVITDADIKDIEFEDLEITVDVYELSNAVESFYYGPNNKSIDYAMMQTQFCGVERVTNKNSKLRLDFNHPTNHIIISSSKDNKLKNINLEFDSNLLNIDMSEVKIFDGHYIIPLTRSLKYEDLLSHSINFSRIDKINLCLNYEDEIKDHLDVSIYGICTNIMSVSSGMTGLRYSN
jgi:hypothetical protein